jgi:hypothetical protein
MTKNIEIKYRYVPPEIIKDFEIHIDESLSVDIIHDNEDYDNFIGGPADVIVYINQHLTELIIGGYLINATYDGIKYAIIGTWKKIVKYYSKQKNELQKDKNFIKLKFKVKSGKTVEFDLNGNISEKLIESLTDKIFSYLKNQDQQEIDFSNRELKNMEDFEPTLRFHYNSKSKKWEPVNYTLLRKQIEELMRKASEDFDS